MPWTYVFLAVIWLLWKDRNKLVFERICILPQVLGSNIFQHAHYTSLAHSHMIGGHLKESRWVKKQPPKDGFYKLNTYGSCSHASGLDSAGGLIRDSSGRWVHGFITNIGKANSFIAELRGLREGLLLCRSLSLGQLVVELDYMVAVQMINDSRDPGSLVTALMLDIQSIMGSMEFCSLSTPFDKEMRLQTS
ncbi:hypothetical protein SLE2022_292280 [Rubroshorea leprosula]